MHFSKLMDRLVVRFSHTVLWIVHVARYFLMRLGRRNLHGVRVIVERDNKILLVRHWFAPGVWTLPGGGIQKNETAQEAGAREVLEETGITVTSFGGEVGQYHGGLGKKDTVSVLYTANTTGHLRIFPGSEILEREFFSADNLPQNCSPANRHRIEAYVAGVRDERGTW